MRRVLIAAVAAALLTAGFTTGLAADNHDQGWPTTCVALNDIVEAHLGNQGNAGIYQNTFGDQAEAACQSDHRNDVRGTFAWAFADEASQPQPNTFQVSGSGTYVGDRFYLPTGHYRITFSISGNIGAFGTGTNFIAEIEPISAMCRSFLGCGSVNEIAASGTWHDQANITQAGELYLAVTNATGNWTVTIAPL